MTNSEEPLVTTCDCCCERAARHLIYSNGVETRQCCKCYVEAGGPPADWHAGCMRAVDRLNEAPNIDDCTRYLRGISGRFKPENPDELKICRLALAVGASKTLRASSGIKPIAFEVAMFDGQAGKDIMIRQGYVPPTCTLDPRTAGPLIYSEISNGRSPCDECNEIRSICRGKPKKYRLTRTTE